MKAGRFRSLAPPGGREWFGRTNAGTVADLKSEESPYHAASSGHTAVDLENVLHAFLLFFVVS